LIKNIEWKCINEFGGTFQISTAGLVRRIEVQTRKAKSKCLLIKAKIIKPRYNNCGYLEVRLSKGGRTYTRFVHKLVAEAFVPNPDNLLEVNHISGDKTDNAPANLAWVTHAQNVQHAYDNGLNKNKGGSHAFAVGVIDNALGTSFATIKEWAEARGISYSTARNVLNGWNTSKTINLSDIVLIKHNYNDK
jgi:HNH endonuclease/NUMOD4 motif